MNNFIKILCVSICLIPAAKAMDVNLADLNRQLRKAAQNGDHTLVQQLIKAKADINSTNARGGTALMYAAGSGEPSCVQALINAKANVNDAALGHGQTALMLAAMNGNFSCAQVLIAANAHINQTDISGITALHYAAGRNHQNVCEQLLDALLKRPNKSQKESILAVLTCGTKRKGFFKKYMVPKEIGKQIAKYMLEACEQKNRAHFAGSVAHQEIMKLRTDNVKNNLLEKYNPKQSKCSIQ